MKALLDVAVVVVATAVLIPVAAGLLTILVVLIQN